jgi:hypothetical protein
MEANQESGRQWTTFLPIQVSALSTLVAGVMSMNSETSGPGIAGLSVGAGWLAFSTVMAMKYTPYASAVQNVGPLPKGTVREQLTRERAAEEEIRSIAATGQRIRWLAILSNLGTAAYMISQESKLKDPVTGTNYPATISRYAAAALSLSPLVFGFHWSDVKNQQQEYKKRIYAPVASATFLLEPATQTLVPGMLFSMRF